MVPAPPPVFQPRNPDWEAEARANVANQPVMASFGVTLAAIAPGHCVLEMPFDRRWTQQTGVLQAGVPAVLADSAGGVAGLSLMAPNSDVLAVEFKINFLAPAAGSIIRADARVVKPGRTLTITQVDVYGVAGDAVTHAARMQQTLIRVDRPVG